MRSFKRLLTGGILITIWSVSASAQQLTLPDAIRIAQENSYDAQLARFSFLASYWTYRSFKAELLPSVNLNGGLANFDHSLVAVRNYEDGQVAYVNNNSMTNHLTLSLDQQIAATGFVQCAEVGEEDRASGIPNRTKGLPYRHAGCDPSGDRAVLQCALGTIGLQAEPCHPARP